MTSVEATEKESKLRRELSLAQLRKSAFISELVEQYECAH